MKLSIALRRFVSRSLCAGFVLSSTLLGSPMGQLVSAAEEQGASDEVPQAPEDASPSELVAFAEKMFKRPENVSSQKELQAYFIKTVAPAVRLATERVISNLDAETKEVAQAIEARSRSLMYLTYMGVEKSPQMLTDYHRGLLSDKRPEVVAIAKRLIKETFLQNWNGQSKEDKAEYVAELIEETKAKKINKNAVRQLGRTLGEIARSGDAESSKAISDALFPLFRNSENQEVVNAVEQLAVSQVIQSWRTLDQEAKDAFVAKWVEKMQSEPVTAGTAQSIQRIVGSLERGDSKAAEVIRDVAIVEMKKSEKPQVLQIVERFEGSIRYANLVGNEMKIEGNFLDGSKLDMSEYKGKVVLVDFWATWCGPCIAEIPHVLHEYKRYHGKGFEVLGISLDENKQACIDFMKERNLPWKTLIGEGEEKGWNQPTSRYYAISGIPSTVILGKDGKVVTTSARGRALTKVLQELLGDPLEVEEEAEVAEKSKAKATAG